VGFLAILDEAIFAIFVVQLALLSYAQALLNNAILTLIFLVAHPFVVPTVVAGYPSAILQYPS
jgi:hypothetical protein